jgi:hypothetical protein
MKRRLVFLLIGVTLLFVSLPLSSQMVMELIHEQKMNGRYEITNANKADSHISSKFYFHENIVEIKETLKQEGSYIDPWNNEISLGDLSMILNGQQIDTLNEYPVRIHEKGIDRYHGEIALLTLKDKKNNNTKLIILLKKTRELRKKMPNGNIVGWVPEEKWKYALYSIDQKGNMESESFSFTERGPIQTELLNAGNVLPFRIGYYTDAWEWYPTLFFPFSFPFLTLLVGIILTFVYFPKRKKTI